MHPSSLHIAEFSAQRSSPVEFWLSCSFFNYESSDECSDVAQTEGLGYRNDPELWDPAGWFLEPGLVFSSTPNRTSPSLSPMNADEFLIAFEREIMHRTSVEISYIKKDTWDLLEDTCNGNLLLPSKDAACDHFVVTNIPGAARNYEGWHFRFESRALDRMHVIASYVNSDSKGSIGGFDITGAFDLYPYHFENRYGYLGDHSRHRVKINGFVRLPWDFTLGVGAYWNSEFRWTPTDSNVPGMSYGVMFVEPRGSRSENGTSNLDLQLSKAFRLGPTRLTVIGTVYSFFNDERPLSVCGNVTGCGEFQMGEPIAWQSPRRYEAGVRIVF